MNIDFELIRNKQRIAVIGNEGTLEITKIACHVLETIGKPYDYILADGSTKITEAPLVLLQGDDHISEGETQAEFLKLRHHMALIHHIEDVFPKEYKNLDEYFRQYEVLADRTPKGGTIIYNKEDNLAMVVGTQRDREDVRLIEYTSLEMAKTDNGFVLDGVQFGTANKNFPSYAGAVKSLLSRLGVRGEQFLTALESYQDN